MNSNAHAVNDAVDADWVDAFFRDADTLDVARLASWFVDAVEVRFGNGPPIHGRAAAEDAFRQFYGSLSGMRHRREELLASGNLVAQMAVVTYVRQDKSEVSMPVASHLRRAGDRQIDRLWIFIDLAPLFGSAEAAR